MLTTEHSMSMTFLVSLIGMTEATSLYSKIVKVTLSTKQDSQLMNAVTCKTQQQETSWRITASRSSLTAKIWTKGEKCQHPSVSKNSTLTLMI